MKTLPDDFSSNLDETLVTLPETPAIISAHGGNIWVRIHGHEFHLVDEWNCDTADFLLALVNGA